MSYVWSQEQVDRYFGYYRDITDHHELASVSYDTTEEFVRSVLPPCLEPAARPTVSVGVSAFMEFVGGAPNRPGRDRAALIGVNARHGGLEGIYYLTVVETEEVNIVTGRELWGMPKKQGQVDFFNDGDRLFGYVERRGHRLIELEATLGPDEGPGEPQTEIYFELRGHFGANGVGLTDPRLLIFENRSTSHRSQALTDVKLKLAGSPYDPGVGTIPLGAFQGGVHLGGETSWILRKQAALEEDPSTYVPYLLGRLYDDWPDLRAARATPTPSGVPMRPTGRLQG